MTPIMLERLCKDIEANKGKLDKIRFSLCDGTDITGPWHWMNHGQGGLDSIIVVQDGGRIYYLTVDHIAYVSIAHVRRDKK
jgi:hypothetical protein